MSLFGLWFVTGPEQLSLLVIGASLGHWHYYLNYLSGFAENWLKGVYMCQDGTCEIISLSDPFKSYDQKSKFSIYVYHWMRRIRFRVKISLKILAPSDTQSDYAIHCTRVLTLHRHR